jgi:hypothetical protein
MRGSKTIYSRKKVRSLLISIKTSGRGFLTIKLQSAYLVRKCKLGSFLECTDAPIRRATAGNMSAIQQLYGSAGFSCALSWFRTVDGVRFGSGSESTPRVSVSSLQASNCRLRNYFSLFALRDILRDFGCNQSLRIWTILA